MENIRFEGILELPPIARFVPEEHYKVQLEPVSIVHISAGFLRSIEGILEESISAAGICMQTLQRKFDGDNLCANLHLGSYPTHLCHMYESLKGQPKGEPELNYATRWTKTRTPSVPPLLVDRRATSFLYFDADMQPHIARLYYYDKEKARESDGAVFMSFPRSGWVIAERQPGSADWAYPGERVGHYNI